MLKEYLIKGLLMNEASSRLKHSIGMKFFQVLLSSGNFIGQTMQFSKYNNNTTEIRNTA